MEYIKFIEFLKKQDSRNIIEETEKKASNINPQLVEFYEKYDPQDVEIVLKDLTAVKLYPRSYLQQLQDEYQLGKEYYVFATKNSDPIAISEAGVVTLTHGSNNIKVEVLARSFDDYLCKLMENVKI